MTEFDQGWPVEPDPPPPPPPPPKVEPRPKPTPKQTPKQPQRPKKRLLAYLGLDVSEGIIIGRQDGQGGSRLNRDGTTVNEGVKVCGVVQDGPAMRAGLRPDDMIIAFNGIPLRGLEDWRHCFKQTTPGQDVELHVSSGGVDPPERVVVQTDLVAEEDFEPGVRRT